MTPDKYTIKESYLEVGDGHTLYIHDWGNKSAEKPIIFLHGGPGSNVRDKFKALFNPTKQRVIFFDQRGCGKSTPYGEITNNTTDKLINDIELIAENLNLEKFIINGGSWGSCLALAYTIARPKRVIGLVLNGIFTGSKSEINWLNRGDFKLFYPEVWDKYLNNTPKEHQSNPTDYHIKQIKSKNKDDVLKSAYVFDCLESAVMNLDDRFEPDDIKTYDPAGAIIEITYLENNCFMPDRYIIDNVHKITAPVWLVQGRYDMICPPITAYEIHSKLPNSKIFWTISGHGIVHENWNIMRTILSEITDTKYKL